MEELLGKGLPDPAVNQVRLGPRLGLYAIHLTCKTCRSISIRLSRGRASARIAHVAASCQWAPLVEAMRFNHPAITRLSKIYDRESAQILLRYPLQKVCEQVRRSAVQSL